MKVLRNFKGYTKGQPFKTEGVSDETIKLMVKCGFIKADKKVKTKKADKE